VIHCNQQDEIVKIAEVVRNLAYLPIRCAINERIGLLPSLSFAENGIHDYSELDIQRVEFTKQMRAAGMPIEGLIDYLELIQQNDGTIEDSTEKEISEMEVLINEL
jgi:MerR family transcriptional regulator, aldehyde-responsive regulator